MTTRPASSESGKLTLHRRPQCGELLRASGVRRDVRDYAPYGAYKEMQGKWKVPIGKYGDNYDRYFVRMREIEESIKLVRMALDGLPEGPVLVDDYRLRLPAKGPAHPVELEVELSVQGSERRGWARSARRTVRPGAVRRRFA